MRTTLTVAAFIIAGFLPNAGHAAASDAGDAGASREAEGGTPSAGTSGNTASTGTAGTAANAGKGGASGAPPNTPGISLPDPGTDESNSCTVAGPHGTVGVFGTTLALGAAFLMLRRRRAR
jgi:hypothetical protein